MCILRTALCSSFTDKYRAGRQRGRGRSQRVGEKHVDGEVKIAREFYNERWRDAGGLGDTG